MSTEATASSFDAAASRVVQRVVLRRWLSTLSATLWWAVGALVIAALLRWSLWLPTLLVLAWTGAAFAWGRYRAPAKYEALALWDKVTGRFEAFAAAWWFAREPALSPMQQRHVDAQQAALPAALAHLTRDLPLPADRRLWLVPGLLALAAAWQTWQPVRPGDVPMNDAMQTAARQEAQRIASDDWTKKKLDGLDDAEKRALDKLKQDVANAAKSLEKGNASSARDVLSSLEQRARDAEKLAERLGAGTDMWASAKMIEAMRGHADTADLGDASASRQAAQTSKAADDLSTTLRSPKLTDDTRNRMTETLRDIAAAAEPKDRERTVGSHVLKAADHLEQQQVMAAAQAFEELAKKMRDTAQREEARKQLEQLAQQLRDAGSRIAGQQAGGMQQMAGTQSQAQQQTAQAGQTGQAPQAMSQNSTSQQAILPPGLGQQQQQSQSLMQQQPQTGSGASQQQMSTVQGQMQQGAQNQGSQSRPTLFAPDPRAKADQKPNTLLMGQNQPPSGNAQSTAMSMPGGQQAGSGKAKLDAPPTSPSTQTRQSSVVTAASGADGASSTRAVEGGIREESATRTSQQAAMDLIHEQEAALDDASLPPARREQVRRYFQELRKRFEAAPQ